MHKTHASRAGVAAACAIAAAVLVAPAATAAVTDHGGATLREGDHTAAVEAAVEAGPARNVILLIGDGMGDSEITIARNYAHGAGGKLEGIDELPLRGAYTTYSLHRGGDEHGDVNYVPDSAATGSAWATGTKTFNGAISVDLDSRPQDTILELAKANGLRTGNVSTAEIQDATPAVLAAHVDARKCYGPESSVCGADALEEGGLGSISEQLLDTRPDLVLGGGSASFDETARAGQWEGMTLFDQAEARGYQVVRNAEELGAVTSANQEEPLLGLFTPGNFPTRFAESTAVPGGDATPISCSESSDRLPEQLSLGALTSTAIDLLDDSSAESGFFLQVEGASIDKRNHSADVCGQIGETIDLDEAVAAALEFAKADGETLVIVTADHAHTSQIVGSVPEHTIGNTLRTTEGSIMHVAYGTAEAGSSQQHTGAQVPIAAYGPGAANVVGLSDQTDTFFTMRSALELETDVAALSASADIDAPAEVAPEEDFQITGEGFAGDRQVELVIDGETEQVLDVIDASVQADLRARAEAGEMELTLRGVHSRVEVSSTVAVTDENGEQTPEDPEQPGEPADPNESEDPSDDPTQAPEPGEEPGDDQASGAGGVNAGGLPNTGAAMVSAGVIAAILAAAGAGLYYLHRRKVVNS